jgi:hypothetical protein
MADMVAVVQWLARLVVAQKLVGSNPTSHPNKKRPRGRFCFLNSALAPLGWVAFGILIPLLLAIILQRASKIKIEA